MYQFPEGVYTEVTVRKTTSTTIVIKNREVEQSGVNTVSEAFIRIFDGTEWMESHISDVRNVDAEIQKMIHNKKAEDRKSTIQMSQIVLKQGRNLTYGNMNITHLPRLMKENLAKECYKLGQKLATGEMIDGDHGEKGNKHDAENGSFVSYYEDSYCTESFVASNGSDFIQDEQLVEIGYYAEKDKTNKKVCATGHYFEDAAEQMKSQISSITVI